MITHLHIENFKSLADFDLPPDGADLQVFTCLIGLNGAGKTTLLQAFDFLGQLVHGGLSEWLDQRDWKKAELLSRTMSPGTGRRSMSFNVCFDLGQPEPVRWAGSFNPWALQCTKEEVWVGRTPLLTWENNELALFRNGEMQKVGELALEFEGSVMSVLKLTRAHPVLALLKQWLSGLKSLELLAPHLLRKRARQAEDIGSGGEKLAAFLAGISPADRKHLEAEIAAFYPQVMRLGVKSSRGGWKELQVIERLVETKDGKRWGIIRAGHLNDGMLRIIAILAQAYSKHSFLLFDEIENGINAEAVEMLVDALLRLSKRGKQVLVTTHSPLVLNYLPDGVAKQSVLLLFKTRSGQTRATRFFELPEIERKLRALGPGEALVDTNLVKVVKQLSTNAGK